MTFSSKPDKQFVLDAGLEKTSTFMVRLLRGRSIYCKIIMENLLRIFKETVCVQNGKCHNPETRGVNTPIFTTSAFEDLGREDVLYPRYFNMPNQEAVIHNCVNSKMGFCSVPAWQHEHHPSCLCHGYVEAAGYRGHMLSFELDDTSIETASFSAQLKLIRSAASLGGGGDHYLRACRDFPCKDFQGRYRICITDAFMRLYVGIENSDDLLADYSTAFNG